MTTWDLYGEDGTHTALVATIDERTVRAAGDPLMPALQFQIIWEDFTATGARERASQRVQAVAFDLHTSHNPGLYWVRTGFLPAIQAHVPTLPLPQAVLEQLTSDALRHPESDVMLTLSVSALAYAKNAPLEVRVHWHQPMHARPISIPFTKWLPMLAHWGYPTTRLVRLRMQLPGRIGQDPKHPAQQLWTAACTHLSNGIDKWTAGRARDAARDLREAVQLALGTWATLWFPGTALPAYWGDVAKLIGEGIPGCNVSTWTMVREAKPDDQRLFAVLQMLRTLNTIANPHHHVGAAPVYTEADVEMLVTATTAMLRSLPDFWAQYPTPTAPRSPQGGPSGATVTP